MRGGREGVDLPKLSAITIYENSMNMFKEILIHSRRGNEV